MQYFSVYFTPKQCDIESRGFPTALILWGVFSDESRARRWARDLEASSGFATVVPGFTLSKGPTNVHN